MRYMKRAQTNMIWLCIVIFKWTKRKRRNGTKALYMEKNGKIAGEWMKSSEFCEFMRWMKIHSVIHFYTRTGTHAHHTPTQHSLFIECSISMWFPNVSSFTRNAKQCKVINEHEKCLYINDDLIWNCIRVSTAIVSADAQVYPVSK